MYFTFNQHFLPVTVQVNMFSKTIKLLQMSQLLQLMMLLLLVLFLLEKSDGDSNSLRFLLRVYMVLKALAENSSLRFLSLCKSGKHFLTRVSILGRLGL